MKILTVIPLYNKSKTVARAIESVLHQDESSCDILIIDDGSTDDSYAVAGSIKNDRITLHRQGNHGVSFSRNLGIKKAVEQDYDYIAFLDADDYWLPNHLNQIKEAISTFPKADIYACNYKIKVGKLQFQKTKFSNIGDDDIFEVEPFFEYNYLNQVLHPSAICMSIQTKKPLFFDEKISHTEDIDFLIRAGINKAVVFNKKVSVVYDETAPNRSNKVSLPQRSLTDFDSYEEYAENNPGLKKFLDINRFAIAMNYRLERDIKNAALYQHKIDTNNLTLKQRKLLNMSGRQLKALKRTQRVLGNLGFRLRTGR